MSANIVPSTQNRDVADELQSLASLLSDTATGIREGSLSLESNTPLRLKVIGTVKDAVDLIKTASDDVLDWIPLLTQFVAIRLFFRWKVFQNIPLGAGARISYEDLAGKVGADVALIARFAAPLVASKFLRQPAADHVAHTPRSQVYTTDNPISAMTQMFFDESLPALCAMPAYFDQFGLKEPTGRLDTVSAFAFGQLGRSVWDILSDHPDRLRNMMLAMAAMEQMFPSLGSYDLSWALAASKDNDRAVLVDVGGGKGQAVRAILQATPGLPAHRCVVEDLPQVVEGAKSSADSDPEMADVRFVGMDFHAEQPVKGALAYYIRRCLHDYGDEECVVMLQRISDAMATDSKLLIVEQVLPNPPSAFAAATDIAMLVIGGKERTIDGFTDITARAGLRILQVYRNQGTDAVLIECAKA
ncbi:O-methyltransferase-domain-containing protein [Schizothecium vesticola]|uniref:O-methyltransferase-domain-containing protein n=1 Tax=Schizothecium vesticola TaxID=314040 RepID=A0AA40BP95_9PEZI|nr:O-methyltransferase-domain-containing protein [Schizothecium vesticola]